MDSFFSARKNLNVLVNKKKNWERKYLDIFPQNLR